jgi:protein O-GlcNAc transferase
MSVLAANRLRREADAHRRSGDILAALHSLDKIINLDQANAQDWYLTGELLSEVKEYAQAIGAFEHCLKIEPNHVSCWYDLGHALFNLGDADRSMEFLERASKAAGLSDFWMGLATIAPGAPGCSLEMVRNIREHYASLVRKDERPLLPALASPRFHGQLSSEQSQLRVGYISAHWHDANYMKPVWPLVNAHDHKAVEVHLFDDSSVVDEKLKWNWLTRPATQTHRIAGLSNRQAAERIRTKNIDLLVDLSAYSFPSRLGLFVHRAASIQAAWFNMYATSGFREFDYLIGDECVFKEVEQAHYVEHVLRLPVSYLSFQVKHSVPPVQRAIDVQRDHFHFGCLGSQYKISSPVLDAWAKILQASSRSKLVLANRDLKSLCNREYLHDQFRERGISEDRILTLPPAKNYDFLKYYDQIDLALDTFPYNGGTTTMEALWQGVPVLTFSGDRWVSRTSQSILAYTHMKQFIAADRDDYVQQAIHYSTDPDAIYSLRGFRVNMREQLKQSPVYDSTKLAREMESLYATMFSAQSGS